MEKLRLEDQGRVITALCDGLGSGVKAHILSTLTSTIATHFAASESNLRRYAEIISQILPECSERNLGYSTFTISDIDSSGRNKLIEFDNPSAILIRNGRIERIKRRKVSVKYGKLGSREVFQSVIDMQRGDRLAICSDGVTESGRGEKGMQWGWEEENLAKFCAGICSENKGLSARQMAKNIVEAAIRNEGGKCSDDATALVINLRRPKKTLLVTGPPSQRKFDAYITDRLKNFLGTKIICGGTTAKIIADKLGRPLHTHPANIGEGLPPASEIEGVDLVTEGILTLSKLEDMLDTAGSGRAENTPAGALMELLLESDIITLIVGTKINQTHHNPDFPIDVEIRRNLARRLKRVLEKNYLKKVEIELV
ncbi:stage II sporulation protein E [Sedimentisphaera cyanobacteriorum]|uniref:Stage II sporulation protein E n=1 Tax=Sedimentisphaera cyanobacteriorum TaxID=1940790 RepID=A0A1Q2HQ55_9BACT|nr:PP2C family protein-serine/threonine phosphatase [Sedimentisphaera cyanobacteriorum]AQQ09490.1 stage II sporulation protein E [Sedimentisphaera cyanobacteriorum]